MESFVNMQCIQIFDFMRNVILSAKMKIYVEIFKWLKFERKTDMEMKKLEDAFLK